MANKQYFNVGITLLLEVDSEAHAIVLRNRILHHIAHNYTADGLLETYCTEPYDAAEENIDAVPERTVGEVIKP